MIRVDRAAEPIPASLRPEGAATDELNRARAYYAANPGKAFKFKVYKSVDVKEALNRLFVSKCAYCETKYAAAMPMEVEHFRPKGGLEGIPPHPGYWWIAASWQNLLPSCIDCNRSRAQKIVAPGMTMEEARRQQATELVGKGTQFPVIAQRVLPEFQNFADEQALLIDPTQANPSDHIEFAIADVAVVLPVKRGDAPDPHGAMSIQVYGLNRLDLVQERTERLGELAYHRAQLEKCLAKIGSARSAEDKNDWIGMATTEWNKLLTFCEPGQRYSAMASQFVQRLRSDLKDELQTLKREPPPR